MRGRRAPAGRLARRLDGVADVLAVAQARLAERAALGIEHAVGIAGIRPRLLAADIQLGGAVDAGRRRRRRPARRCSLAASPASALRGFGASHRLQIFRHALAAALAAEAAFAIAAEAGGGVEQVGAIDPDHAGLDARGDFERAIDVLASRPRRRGRSACCWRARPLRRACGSVIADQHRAEDLLARQQRGGLDVGDQGRRIEAAARRQRDLRLTDVGALGAARFDQPLDALELHRRDDGADVGRFVQRIADAQRRHARAQLGDEFARRRSPATSSREPAQQTWPWLNQIASTTPSTALSRSASSNTMNGDLPPSSSDSFLPVPAVARRMMRPTSVEPVKAILSTSGCSTIAAPVSPSPVTMLTTPGGRPASTQISANGSAVSGVNSAGFSTTVLPAASAGAIFQASISSGKFQGMICPQTPTGPWPGNSLSISEAQPA